MANIDRSKKLLVRTALVAGSTVATLVGAQSFALFDKFSPTVDPLVATLPTEVIAPTVQPTVEFVHQAPSIVILRGQQEAVSNGRPRVSAPVIAPPSPQVSAPNPVIIQQQAPVAGRSSR